MQTWLEVLTPLANQQTIPNIGESIPNIGESMSKNHQRESTRKLHASQLDVPSSTSNHWLIHLSSLRWPLRLEPMVAPSQCDTAAAAAPPRPLKSSRRWDQQWAWKENLLQAMVDPWFSIARSHCLQMGWPHRGWEASAPIAGRSICDIPFHVRFIVGIKWFMSLWKQNNQEMGLLNHSNILEETKVGARILQVQDDLQWLNVTN